MTLLRTLLLTLAALTLLSPAALADENCTIKKGSEAIIMAALSNGKVIPIPIKIYEDQTFRLAPREISVRMNRWPTIQGPVEVALFLDFDEVIHDCPEHGREPITKRFIFEKTGLLVAEWALFTPVSNLTCVPIEAEPEIAPPENNNKTYTF